MDQAVAKKTLQELIKREDLDNKVCVDCSSLNPQWASVSFAIFLCLQCAGVHRGFGVHVSFVRSVSMDVWQPEQIRRMQLGGNKPFKQFMQSYAPADQGGYKEGMSSYDQYHCWAAAQYRQKLDAMLADKPWSPSPPPADFSSPGSGASTPGRPSSAQGLRKSRASARTTAGSSLREQSGSPSSFEVSPRGTPDLSRSDQKSANEAYFSNLGQVNASRPADLPPSQGGRYQGFGNTPSPPPASQHSSFGLSSMAAPSLSDFQEDPTAALGKGWSLFSAAVAGASRVVSENVLQPGMERAMDPSFHASMRSYISEAGRLANGAGRYANDWSKSQFGVDVADHVGGVMGSVREQIGRGRPEAGYSSLSQEEGSTAFHDDTDSFFTEFAGHRHDSEPQSSASQTSKAPAPSAKTQAKKDDDWDDWQDF